MRFASFIRQPKVVLFGALLLFFASGEQLDSAEEKPASDQAQKVQMLHRLQAQAVQLRAQNNPETAQKARDLEQVIAELSKELTPPTPSPSPGDDAKWNSAGPGEPKNEMLQAQLAKAEQELMTREQKLAELSQQMAKLERQNSLPPLPNAEVKVFTLNKSAAAAAARTIESLFGAQTLRVATDERTNSLIVLGAPDSLAAVEALLGRLDQQSTPNYSQASASEAKAAMYPPRSLLLRVFWLASGLVAGESDDAGKYLPASVLEAVDRLGVSGPRVVTQTVTSLALGSEGPVDYTFDVPAVIFNQPANLIGGGHLRPAAEDRVGLDLQLRVDGRGTICQLSGSLSMPLEHYMVLGTANSVVAEPHVATSIHTETTTVDQNGKPATTSPPPASEAKYNTSHFAFVVQVIEAESFAPEAQSETNESQAKAAKK